MEGDKCADSYSSPFDALFGPKGSPPSSTSAVLADIFPPKEVCWGDASRFDGGCTKQGSASEALSAKPGSSALKPRNVNAKASASRRRISRKTGQRTLVKLARTGGKGESITKSSFTYS